ncbi:TPA: LOW QUALITY PROTEIN: hypothetical protein N0F65_006791 [Lagenidium giganteum]|uniref:Maleylacetoacetate isomerase n=1 Tax=Lagenidium giganteum TaxID=4803 RepID=A0AAV2ZE90_9STRA|nr:TPA: LOW QUALITY PROTEIN: hypothetical protein N0F65_006791 [Lagenidium giganteum]
MVALAIATSKEDIIMSAVELYGYWRSSCSYRVRIALETKGIKYEYKAVSLLKDGGEQKKPEFAKLNPNQRVPTLVIDGHVLNQSTAIIEYLEESRPEKPLLPKDPYQRALVRNIVGIIACDTQPIQNLGVLERISQDLPDNAKGPAKLAWGKDWIERGFTALEAELAKCAGKYCVGDAITMADAFLQPQVYNANRFKVDLSKFPHINRISETLNLLSSLRIHQTSRMPIHPLNATTRFHQGSWQASRCSITQVAIANGDVGNEGIMSAAKFGCSHRVRIALASKGIEYEYNVVSLLKDGGQQKRPEFAKLNPNKRVPTLAIDGHVLNQSTAIIEYLEETRPEKPLLPKDPYQRALVRNIVGIIGCDTQPLQNLGVLERISRDLPNDAKGHAKMAWAKEWIERGFTAVETELAKCAGKYCVGDAITMADVFLQPQVYNAHRFKVDLSKFPHIELCHWLEEPAPPSPSSPPLSSMDRIELCGFWRSSCTYRVRIALAHKRIAYEYKSARDLSDEEFARQNPNERVPTLIIDGHVLHQSGAIIEYLEETRPERPLLPDDPYQRAQVRNIVGIVGCDTQPLQNLGLLRQVSESSNVSMSDVGTRGLSCVCGVAVQLFLHLPEAEREAAQMAQGKKWIERSFHALEQELAKCAGTYSVGDSLTMADTFLQPQLYNACRFFLVDLAPFPHLARVAQTLAADPAVVAADPSALPDAQAL